MTSEKTKKKSQLSDIKHIISPGLPIVMFIDFLQVNSVNFK